MIKRSVLTLIFTMAMIFGFGSAAAAEDDCGQSPQVDCVGVLPSAPGPVAAAPVPETLAGPVTTVTPRQTLPVTGTETAVLAIGGLLLVGAGGALVWRSNKAAA